MTPTMYVEDGDRVRLLDGLTHLCIHVSFNGYVHFRCMASASNDRFPRKDVNTGPVTCLECAITR